MLCPACQAQNDEDAEACFTCGKALFALTHGILLASRYEILRPLGRGGMGRVYKAHDRVLDENAAIKVLRSELTREPEMARRFRSEIKLARKVSHRNVCRIHEYGEEGPLSYISMEYIEGINLKDFLHERSLSTREKFDLVIQIAEGLRAVHDHGIIHRDFKASNIMIDARGFVKLMDFGIAKEATADATDFTGSGQVMGTPEYMSPEQGGGARVDFRSDIYSLGCVVFEVFTGRAPFRGETPLATLYKHLHEPPPLEGAAAPALPEPLVPVLRKALAKEPSGRFASVAEFAEALRRARSASGVANGATQPVVGTPRAAGGSGLAPPVTTTLDTPSRGRLAASLPAPGLRRRPGASGHLWPWVGATLFIFVAFVSVRGARGPADLHAPARGASPIPGTPLASPPLETPAPTPTARPAPAAATAVPGRRQESGASFYAPIRRASTPAGKRKPNPASPVPGSRVADTQPAPGTAVAPSPDASLGGREAAEVEGTLQLLVVPEAEVTIDGVSIGPVSMRELSLSEGAHVIRILHPQYEVLQRTVRIRGSEPAKLVLDLAEKGIRRN